jgi:hypothetical protein
MAADVGNELQKYIQEIASVAAAGNEHQSEWVANISEETKANDTQILAMSSQIKVLDDAFKALTKSMSKKENNHPEQATQTQAIPHTHSTGRATWEGTAGHTAITQSASNTTAAHALRKKMDPRMMQRPQTIKAVTTSGQTSTRSRNCSRIIPVSKENWHPPTDLDWGHRRIVYIKTI